MRLFRNLLMGCAAVFALGNTAAWGHDGAKAVFQEGDVYDASEQYVWPTDTLVVQKLKAWQDLKFGVLLHWGLYAVPGIVESWSICDEDWIRRDTTMTYEQYKRWYWGLAEEFRPTAFDPAQWADVMSQAGMRYMLFTTKHHDGFCMWDSHETDFSIACHAFRDDPRRDVLRHVLNAFRERQFMVGTYFSKPDWHSQDYWWDVYATKGRNVNYPVSQHPQRWQRFRQFTYRQLEEILSGYGSVDVLWLDGGWVYPEKMGQDIGMPDIANMGRRHQPGLLVVDRTIGGPYENYVTPERTVPEKQLPYPWESCMPLSDDWGYVKHPRWKSAERVINTLIEVVAKGGNLVLGVGPTPDGLIETAAVERLQQIGLWLQANGAAIYHTVPVPVYRDGDVWFTASHDGRTVYAILMIPEGGDMPTQVSWTAHLPAGSVRLVSNGRRLPTSISNGRVTVTLPRRMKAGSLALQFSPQP